MKSSKFIQSFFALSAGLLAAALSANSLQAQLPGAGKSAGGMNAAMVHLFGPNTNFICRAEAHVFDKAGHEITTMPMNFEMLGSRIRVGINMAEVKSKEVSPDFIASMKQMGMDQMITIILPDKKIIRSIYPGLKSYADTAMDKVEADSASKNYKIDKIKAGVEKIDSHMTEKDTVTVTDDKGVKQKAICWYATDLHDFLLQVQIDEAESILILKFKDVKLGRPETAHFDAPAGFTKYDNVNALMSEAITKRMTGGAK